MSERSLSSPTNIPIFKPYRPDLYPPYILYLSYCHAYVSLLPILWQLTAKLLADYCQAVGSNRGKASLSHSISTKEQKKKNTTPFCRSENIVYLCGVLLVIMPEVQDILIAHFSTESPPRKEESELFLNKLTTLGFALYKRRHTHSS